jgi:hypothetical protein
MKFHMLKLFLMENVVPDEDFGVFSSPYKTCKVSLDLEQGMIVKNIQGCLKNSTSTTYY